MTEQEKHKKEVSMADLENLGAQSPEVGKEFSQQVQAELDAIASIAKGEAELHGGKKNGGENIQKLEEEIVQLKESLLRSLADSDNLRKRYEKQIEDASKFAISSFLKDLLPSIDNLYRASDSIPQDKLVEDEFLAKLYDGLLITQKSFTDIFAKHGLLRIVPASGDAFDHNFHQAVVTIVMDDMEPGLVIACLQPGYALAGRLIRPSMVSVSRKI